MASQILGIHLSGISALENGLGLGLNDFGDGRVKGARLAEENEEAHEARMQNGVFGVNAESPLY